MTQHYKFEPLTIEKFTEIVNNLDLIKDVFNTAKYKLIFLS